MIEVYFSSKFARGIDNRTVKKWEDWTGRKLVAVKQDGGGVLLTDCRQLTGHIQTDILKPLDSSIGVAK